MAAPREARWVRSVIEAEDLKIRKIRAKKIIRVAFVVLHEPTWKTDRLFRLMMSNPVFSPCILVAPDVHGPEDWSGQEMQKTYEFFQKRGFEVHLGSRDDDKNRALLREVAPDVIFLNNPHGLTCHSLHMELIEKYLTCYVAYHIEVGRYNRDQAQYNRTFHNAIWKIFAPHEDSFETYTKVQKRKGENVVVTGYPGLEVFSTPAADKQSAWKCTEKKRIIWAPHHTINMPALPYSNFLRYADLFISLAKEYSRDVHWSFKPHPLLEPNLCKHPDWGPERTAEFYEFWRNSEQTQLDLGGYDDLFKNSDAMIHDSGSFLAEYLYVDKPVLYLWSSPDVQNFFNGFGQKALAACSRADDEQDIRTFIDCVIRGDNVGSDARRQFRTNYPLNFSGEMPSDLIIKELATSLRGPT